MGITSEEMYKGIETGYSLFRYKTINPGVSDAEFRQFLKDNCTREERSKAKRSHVDHLTSRYVSEKATRNITKHEIHYGDKCTRADVAETFKDVRLLQPLPNRLL